ncbi:ADP-ribosylating toxin [Pseudomonas lijiangensis]|uniref:dermonecrotic toxin domain-containing protein n=1 Tax=Pseudomonas lijiangensis TaxID=2995658 RepID=UPI0034D73C56
MPTTEVTRIAIGNDEHRLKTIARAFIDDYPDIHGLAYAEARKLLFRHTGKWLDPESIYWHRFSTAVSNPRTLTGWQHSGPPVESMTFVELMIRRFSVDDQNAGDELASYGGFYRGGPQQRLFDEHNEVALHPRQVLDDFWALDFSALFTARMERFWTLHRENFCTLARSAFMASAGLQMLKGRLNIQQFKLITETIIGRLQPVMTYDALRTGVIPRAGLTLRTFDIGGYVCTESIRIVDGSGQQILYLPGDTDPFHVFASDKVLYEWVQERLLDTSPTATFKKLFIRSATARQLHGGFFDEHARQILDTPWVAGQTLINSRDFAITGDAFVHLRGLAREQMREDAQTLLTSNTDLRKQIWLGYLNAFSSTFGGLATLGWPMALLMVGVSSASLVLEVDRTLQAREPRQRKAGIISVIYGSISLVFNLAVLVGILRTGAGSRSTGAAAVSDTSQSIPMVELSPPALPATGASANMRGVQMLSNGETWINLGDVPYRVVFNDELNAWTLTDPANPLASDPGRAVHLNARNEWEWREPSVTSTPVLAASDVSNDVASGAFVTVRSSFWDVYMQFNLAEEERLSQNALARQKSIMIVPFLNKGDLIAEDLHGNPLYIDEWGDAHHIFRRPDGRYVGGRIPLYSAKDSSFNKYLRTGISTGPAQVDLIDELADDLRTIGFDNSVSLYRGGSDLRGTSGRFFRNGQIKSGDVLVSTDILSFSENPYVARAFCSSQAGEYSASFARKGILATFDDSSVVFELPARNYLGATPVAPFSTDPEEVESIFLPGRYFLIDDIHQVSGINYRFIKVRLIETSTPKVWHKLYDLRTGEPFTRERYAAKLGEQGQRLVDRFFPANPRGLSF